MIKVVRVLKNSWKGFARNLWLSFANLLIMFLALGTMGGLLLFNASIETFVEGLQERVDVSVYFNEDADEEDILELMEQLEEQEETREVQYVSRDEALDIFTDRHADNPILLESLEELEDNPLQASLNIAVHDPNQFEQVITPLEENEESAALIDNINFAEKENVIRGITSVSESVNRAGVLFSIILGILVVFVTYNTIRLAIYSAREEIHIMKLVGAGNWFVRGPYILTGALYGIVSTIMVVGSFLGVGWLMDSQVSLIFADINFFEYLIQNFALFTLTVLGTGVAVGTVSSYFAVRKYLKV